MSFEDFLRQGPQAATEPPDSFGSFLQSQKDDTLHQAQAVTVANSSQSPDTAASAAKLVQPVGLPQAAIETDVPRYQQQAQNQKNSALLSQNPVLASWVASNPDAARVAQGEYDKLSTIEKTWRSLRAPFIGLGQSGNDLMLAVDRAAVGATGLFSNDAAEWLYAHSVAHRLAARQTLQNATQGGGFTEKALESAGQMLGTVAQIVTTGGEGKVAAGLPELFQGVGRQMMVPSLVSAVNTGDDVYQNTGSLGASLKAAAMSYGLTTLQGAVPLSVPGGLASRLATGAVSGVASGEISREAMNAVLPPEMQSKFDPQNFALNAVTGAIMGGVLGPRVEPELRNAVRETYTRAYQARVAADAQGRLQTLGEAVTDSKLKDSSPSSLRQFVESVTDGSPLDAVYVNAQKLRDAFAQSAVEPSDEMSQRLAASMGEDVRVPIDEYAATISGTPVEKAILPELRAQPDGMTFSEAEQHFSDAQKEMSTRAEQIVKEREQRTAFEQDKGAVYQNILDQLNATGRHPESVNKAYATLIAEHYGALASRENVMPSALFKKHPLTIATEGQGLQQPAFHGSPYQFDKFTTEKIGTGEGAQAYGWGLYFAGNRAVAEEYRRNLTAGTPQSPVRTFKGQELKPGTPEYHAGTLLSGGRTLAAVRKEVAGWIKNAKPGEDVAHYRAVLDALNAASKKSDFKESAAKGQLYHVEIPPDETMLHWDKPLSEQPEAVRKALETEIAAMPGSQNYKDATFLSAPTKRGDEYQATGRVIYNELARTLGAQGASMRLHDLGIQGIKYLDGRSRAAGEGSHNYVVFNDESVQILERYYQDQRGAFDPVDRTMALLKSADLSTALHESGHLFLDNLERIAAGGSESAKADMDLLLRHFGEKGDTPEERLQSWLGKSLDQKRSAHEQFAEGFERYLMEGKAPSEQMRSLFGRFRAWLLNVYQQLRGQPIDPEVKGVMDRMLASDEAIKDMEAQRSYAPLFEDAKAMGVDAEEFNKYVELGQQATEAAVSKLQAQSLKDMKWVSGAKSRALKALQKQAEQARQATRAKVEEEVNKNPAFQAQDFLKQNAEDRAGRTDLNMVAAMHGFDSEKSMRQAIMDAGNKEDVINAETDRRMLQEHGELTDPQSVENAANEAVHNEARARFMATGLKVLTKSPLPAAQLARAAKAVAEATIAKLKTGELRSDLYLAAEARANREAIEQAAKSPAKAIEAQRTALLNNRLARAAMDAQAEVAKGLKYLKGVDSRAQAIGSEYMDRINELLSNYDVSMRTASTKAVQNRQQFRAWLESEFNRTGVMPEVPEALSDFANTRSWKELSVEEFRGLLDAVHSLEHVGKEQTLITIAGKKQALDDLVARAKADMASLPHSEPVDLQPHLLHAKGLDKVNALFLKAKEKVKGIDAAVVKMEQLFQWLTYGERAGLGEERSGPFLEMFQRASEAEGKERAMRAEAVKGLKDLNGLLKGTDIHESLNIPELPRRGRGAQWYREELLSAALNTGNEGNLQKLAEGYGWSPDVLEHILDKNLSDNEWKFVQGVWNLIGKYGEPIRDLQKRQTGIAPKMVTPRRITNSHGTFDGGYFPVVYDAFLDRSIERREAQKTDALFENQWAQPMTSQGHTVSRTGYVGPIHLSLGEISRHIDQVTHDLAWREPIADINKFLSHKDIVSEVDQTMGREYRKQFRPWLQAMANDKVFNTAVDTAWEGFYRKVRSNATLVGLGFRMSTMMIHGASALSNSLGEVGLPWFAKGAAEFSTPQRWSDSRQFIYERSPEMANRFNEMDRNVREAIEEINRHQSTLGPISATQKTVDAARRFAFYGVSALDMGSAAPTWMGAYLKAMAPKEKGGSGLSEEQAIDRANRAVRNAHGGGGVKDLSAVQRDKGAMSMFTLFYSYWNHMYNRQRDLFKGYGNLGNSFSQGTGSRDFAKLLARSWFYFVVPQLIHALLKPSPQQDDDPVVHMAKEVGLGFVSGVPVLRDLASAVVNGRDYTITPLEEAGKAVVAAATDTAKAIEGEEMSAHAGKHFAMAAGYAAGLPMGQVSNTTAFLWDVYNGDAQPEDVKDWYQGIQNGKISP